MNSIKIDFQKTPKSKSRIIVGALMMLLSVTYLIFSNYSEGFQWFIIGYGFALFFIGLSHFAEGSGHTISKYFGDAFLSIDDNQYEYKPSQYKSSAILRWDMIEVINFGITGIDLKDKSSNISHLEYSRFTYQQVQDIKSVLTSIAEKNDINIYK